MRDPDTFHALLSRPLVAGGSRTELTITPPVVPTAGEAARFVARDAVRAAVLANKSGLDRNIFIGLVAGLRNDLKTEGEMAMLAELAASLGDPQTSLRVGKTAIARGMNLVLHAYPIDPFPDYEPLRPPPETALLLGITRQETEFNTSIVSWAGARGLMQVMPVTARHVCQQHKVKCDLPRLMTDHAYNARIASAYIADRMAELGGWYAVSLAAYNAGPGRARQWIRQNGDPRTADIDTIDWIERIPIEETRGYVEKVLSNIQVYRARLGEPMALRLVEDLTKPTGVRQRTAAD
jgi:soluble lytic murein transglycosylase